MNTHKNLFRESRCIYFQLEAPHNEALNSSEKADSNLQRAYSDEKIALESLHKLMDDDLRGKDDQRIVLKDFAIDDIGTGITNNALRFALVNIANERYPNRVTSKTVAKLLEQYVNRNEELGGKDIRFPNPKEQQADKKAPKGTKNIREIADNAEYVAARTGITGLKDKAQEWVKGLLADEIIPKGVHVSDDDLYSFFYSQKDVAEAEIQKLESLSKSQHKAEIDFLKKTIEFYNFVLKNVEAKSFRQQRAELMQRVNSERVEQA